MRPTRVLLPALALALAAACTDPTAPSSARAGDGWRAEGSQMLGSGGFTSGDGTSMHGSGGYTSGDGSNMHGSGGFTSGDGTSMYGSGGYTAGTDSDSTIIVTEGSNMHGSGGK